MKRKNDNKAYLFSDLLFGNKPSSHHKIGRYDNVIVIQLPGRYTLKELNYEGGMTLKFKRRGII